MLCDLWVNRFYFRKVFALANARRKLKSVRMIQIDPKPVVLVGKSVLYDETDRTILNYCRMQKFVDT